MQISRNWLEEFVEIKFSDDELCNQLTMLGLEVEGFSKFKSKITGTDTVIKLDLTPNRGDCFSVLGVAREVAALNNLKLRLPEIRKIKISAESPIEVKVSDEAPIYSGRYISGLNLKDKVPPLIQERLKRSNFKSIDPIVDITNYVLLELGQPLHAFDSKKLNGNLNVRFAKEKEQMELLDESSIKLSKDCLVISDETKAVALAGIMGGADSGISQATSSVYLESAFFKPEYIRGRARRFSLQTEASTRFERGVDFKLQRFAIERASSLIFDFLGGEFAPVQEFKKNSSIPKDKKIKLNVDNINRSLGSSFKTSSVKKVLENLGMKIDLSKTNQKIIKVNIPSWRFDLSIQEDLTEEVARLKGYNNIEETSLKPSFSKGKDPLNYSLRESFKTMGFNEVITYSFIDKEEALITEKEENLVFIQNPISQNMTTLRPSLLPGLLNTLFYNCNRGCEDLAIFELGSVFQKQKNNKISQKEVIGALITGLNNRNYWSNTKEPINFYDLKGNLEQILRGSSNYDFIKTDLPFMHPGKTSLILKDDKEIGYLGAVNPKNLEQLNIKQEVILFEVLADGLPKKITSNFKRFSRFPVASRDLSFIVSNDISNNEVIKLIESKCGKNIKKINLFDIYEGDRIPKNKRSLTYTLSWQSKTKTLTDIEIDKIVENIVLFLSKKIDAKLRS